MDESVLFTPQRKSLPLCLRGNTTYLSMPVPTSPVSNLKCCDSLYFNPANSGALSVAGYLDIGSTVISQEGFGGMS